MKAIRDTAPPPLLHDFLALEGIPGAARAEDETAGRDRMDQHFGVDARTAELRDRIAAASRFPLLGSLLLRR